MIMNHINKYRGSVFKKRGDSMVDTVWSLVPPILAIVMVLLTKRVLLSLGVGIVTAAVFIAHFNPLESIVLTWEAFKGVVIEEGSLNTWNVYILLFVLILGALTALISMMGATRAFAESMGRKVKTKAGAQLMTMALGIIIFVDDYFNSLAVGQIAKPVTDKHRISRAKLAYIVDSTAAPVSVIAPISSWGAYIIGIIGSIFAAHSFTDYSAFNAFIQMIPMNYYVWAALGVVFVIAIGKIDFGPMKTHEDRASKTGDLVHPDYQEDAKDDETLAENQAGKMSDLMIPIIVLVIATMLSMYVSGRLAVGGSESLMIIFGEADVALALLVSGLISLVVAIVLFLRHITSGNLTGVDLQKGIVAGGKSMLPSFGILIFAWAITALIDELGTGTYLSGLIEGSNLSLMVLPLLVFAIAGLIAFATGTSWGAFALLLPIAGQIAVTSDVGLLLPMLAAVLAGAVFGDHCSPISDTTILSSTGASCHHIDHVMTQLPYAIVAAVIAGAGYLVLGISGNVWLGLFIVLLGLILLFGTLKMKAAKH